MTAEEIKNAPESSKTEAGWLKEIAYQLALLNEHEKPKFSQTFHVESESVALTPIKRGPGRPPKTA